MRARLELGAANAELRATQLLWADTVRGSERLRIARDLHDIVGHHLTALNLHLDPAQRRGPEQAAPALATAHQLAQGLLAQMRGVVGAERHGQRIDLRTALLALCAGIPAHRTELAYEAELEIKSGLALEHTLGVSRGLGAQQGAFLACHLDRSVDLDGALLYGGGAGRQSAGAKARPGRPGERPGLSLLSPAVQPSRLKSAR